ncbi:hypothetical protein [Synechococcus sp. PCC 6312]|uniref:hypothetical protein n=1 Tax=Synechococcus sp. (strain ATCC 27167 / PCC 6312) TaxID=195253 RepID=UPI00029F2009|nr:hypothetical protein [Synechococcus sp. PCC 6312]AFY59279.1 amino acid transporter [Synechococcus sp. PCC 6312]
MRLRPRYPAKLSHWLLRENTAKGHEQSQAWWRVMCLTGVDYFSTLGYQPGIAALAAGALSPVATLILILLTLFGALPIYRRVASFSPHGEGSIAMLEHLLPWWQGKLLVLGLLGFMATDFMITITISAADATAHLLENPFVQGLGLFPGENVLVTLVLIVLLALVFLRGFREAVGIAVPLVVVYLFLNTITIIVAGYHVMENWGQVVAWQNLLLTSYPNPLLLLVTAGLLFPKLALGLSGFETGVVVMPLIRGRAGDTEDQPIGRIKNTGKMLGLAAVLMSIFLLSSSLVTILLIPAAEFQTGGSANGRALAYLAHEYLGNGFGTVYDISTILILWFAGASAMAGLLNVVPRYLPRYGMAPSWTRMRRPLVLVYTAIAFFVTVLFQANVDAQGAAYATGVLVLMSSAAVAVTLVFRHRPGLAKWGFGFISLVFAYTTLVNIAERPEGIKIASFFIGVVVIISLISRVWRSTELRIESVSFDPAAMEFIHQESNNQGIIRLIAHRYSANTGPNDYQAKEQRVREDDHIPPTDSVLFLEVQVADASTFSQTIGVQGLTIGEQRVLRTQAAAIPNAIAAILLQIRDDTGQLPHVYFGWAEGHPIKFLIRFILFGEGDTALVTREVLRQAEPDPEQRPRIHVGG